MKHYIFKFDIWALLLFFAIMAPNIIWFVVPAPNDVIRIESVTPVIDIFASIFQVLLVASLFFLQRKDADKVLINNRWIVITILLSVLYYSAWAFYFSGCVSKTVIVAICLLPCFAFLSYSMNRKNIPALIFGIIFTVLHFVFAVMNY